MGICPAIVNSTGLLFGSAGAVLLLIYPPPGLGVTRDGADLGQWENSPSPERRAQNKKRYISHRVWSKVGIALIGVGFFLQLASNWTQCA